MTICEAIGEWRAWRKTLRCKIVAAVCVVLLLIPTPLGAATSRKHKTMVFRDGSVVSVDYSPVRADSNAPGVLLAEDHVWSPGSGTASTFETQIALQIGEDKLPPGQYSLYLAPAGENWILVINQDVGQPANSYPDGWDIVRAATRKRRLPNRASRVSFALERHGSAGGALKVHFGETEVWVDFKELGPETPVPDAS